mgnify:CR=1 FL=1
MKNKVVILVVKFFSIILLFTTQKLLTTYLDVNQYGQFNFFMALINSFSAIVILGSDRLIINQFSFRSSQFKSELISNSYQVLTVLTIFVGLLYSFINLDDYKIYFILGLYFNSLLIIFSSIYRGNNKVILADIIQKILRPLIFILLLLLFASRTTISNYLRLELINLPRIATFI